MFKWIDRHLKTILEIWVVLFTILVIYLFVTIRGEISHNKDRAQDAKNLAQKVAHQQKLIQQGRLHSCQTTYRGVGEVVIPFVRSPRARRIIPRFKKLIEKKVQGCIKQIQAPKKKRG